jgi:peptide/nickel transport system substrate-binding protein
VTFAVDKKGGGAHSFFTDWNDQSVVDLSHQAQRNTDPAKRQELYSQIQAKAADAAFMAQLYYSPYRYATRSDVKGFFVYPLGNYHLEDTWIDK